MKTEKGILKKIIKNILIVVVFIIYFILLSAICNKFDSKTILKINKIASIVILIASIILIEIAYRKEKVSLAFNGMEILVLAFYTLTFKYLVNKFNITMNDYIIISSIVFLLYYVLKIMIIYTDEKRKFLNSFSDIHEIVSNTPVKKKAKKRKNA